MKPVSFHFAAIALGIGCLSACEQSQQTPVLQDNQPSSDHCFTAESAAGRQHDVETGLRKKVRFTNLEPETYSITERITYHQIPAVSVTLIKDNQIDWTQAYGFTDISKQTAIDCNTAFQAASISKPVAMMAALTMADVGKLDLDKDIAAYLKRFQLPQGKQSESNPVTFRNLLNHTSGITPGGYLGYEQGQEIPTDVEVLEVAENVNSQPVEVQFTPGERLMYSGGAYTVAQVALQDVYGKPFAEVMQEWILTPIGMNQSSFEQPFASNDPENLAKGQTFDGAMVKGGWHIHPEQAAAGMWASSKDLALFLIEIGKGYRGESQVFSKQVIDELLANPVAQHAYGFRLQGEGDSLSITHYGGTVGYRSGMTLHLASGNGAVILTNSDNGSGLSQELFLAASSVYQWPDFKQIELEQTQLSKAKLQPLAGTYQFESQGWTVKVEYSETDNQIALIFPNNDKYPLIPTTKTDLHFVYPDNGVEAWFETGGEALKINLYGQQGLKSE